MNKGKAEGMQLGFKHCEMISFFPAFSSFPHWHFIRFIFFFTTNSSEVFHSRCKNFCLRCSSSQLGEFKICTCCFSCTLVAGHRLPVWVIAGFQMYWNFYVYAWKIDIWIVAINIYSVTMICRECTSVFMWIQLVQIAEVINFVRHFIGKESFSFEMPKSSRN